MRYKLKQNQHPQMAKTTDSDSADDRDELKDQLLRVMADNENLRKRTEREVAAAKKYGPLSFARDLLASLDNLEKAITLIPEDKEGMDETVKNILIGVEMTGRELASAFERHGIQRINPEGEKFDYNLHQAMFEVPTDDVEPGMVVQVVQPGYSLHDRLLRPAMVGVSKASNRHRHSASIINRQENRSVIGVLKSVCLLHDENQTLYKRGQW